LHKLEISCSCAHAFQSELGMPSQLPRICPPALHRLDSHCHGPDALFEMSQSDVEIFGNEKHQLVDSEFRIKLGDLRVRES
jgi:hypothetical protein